MKDIEVTEEKIEGDKAEITLKVSYNESDKTETRKVKLVRVNGTWMIGYSKLIFKSAIYRIEKINH
ncbi:DUF4878 domain-containing protein [Helicobacter bilis]|uniref:DUF4878 domain-containing protein n=1 Tax=Helicobacter bilis TaxID=37372 RepID=A0A6D2C741_9HELI|nr:DUF4878 domain-containing protein [Helicobacter bilis]TLE06078.1 DUF4878 domain-containing protein [Helicobacter bilis]